MPELLAGAAAAAAASPLSSTPPDPHRSIPPPPLAPGTAVAAAFEQQHRRFPGPDDAGALLRLKGEACGAAGVDPAALPDEQVAAYAAGEQDMPAINAVVGGVLANEVLKAAGGRDAPLNNFFLFSLAEGGQGVVERWGA